MWFHRRFDFYSMLESQARLSEQGLQALCDFVRVPGPERAARVEKIEKEADEARRRLIEAINRTYVTPLDREDIFALSRTLDDMIDYANSTVEEMMLFQAPTNQHLFNIADALFEESCHITRAVEALRRLPDGIQEHIILAKKAENRIEHLYREALAELFHTPDMATILKLREIYRHLSNAADRGDEAANILSDILIKNA